MPGGPASSARSPRGPSRAPDVGYPVVATIHWHPASATRMPATGFVPALAQVVGGGAHRPGEVGQVGVAVERGQSRSRASAAACGIDGQGPGGGGVSDVVSTGSDGLGRDERTRRRLMAAVSTSTTDRATPYPAG
jgi:hypothetical protein